MSFVTNCTRCSKQRLLELADSLQIQPGNLCQFLPQDVVRDFPTMDNQQIFYNTVKAVGDTPLLGSYNKLKELQKEVEGLEEQEETKGNTLNSLEKKSNRLESEKVLYNKRKEVEKKKTEIENCIKWKTFTDLRKSVKDTRDKDRVVKDKVKGLEDKRRPLKDFLADYEAKVGALRGRLEVADREYNTACGKVEDYDMAELEDQLDRLTDQEKDLASQEQSRVSQRARIEREVGELGRHLAQVEADPRWQGLDQAIADKMARRAKHENNLQRSEQTLADHTMHLNQATREVERITKAIQDLEDKKERKLRTLEKENQDTYRGVLWLRDNRDKFSKPVHDPIMLSLDVKQQDYARYVESHVGKADLEGFICEDAQDVNRLTLELREKQKLRRINVFHSNPEPPEAFKPPFPAHQLQQFGFERYLSDMYEAPDAVNAYLCRQKKLNEVPVFREENQNSGQLKGKFTNYYIGMQKFNSRRSKYSGELSVGTDDIGGRPVRRLAGAVDKEALNAFKEELAKKVKLRESQEVRRTNMDKTCQNVKTEIANLNNEISELRMLKKDHTSKGSELAMKRRTLEQLVEPRLDLAGERRRIRGERAGVVRQLARQLAVLQGLAGYSVRMEEDRRLLHLALQNIESENSEGRERLVAVERELEAARAEMAEITARWEKDKRLLQEKHQECRKATGILSDEVKYKPPEAWQARFDLLGSTDINVLGAMLEEQDTELRHISVIPEKVIEDIEALARRVEAARKERDDIQERMKNKNHEAMKLRRKWMAGVEAMVERINESFGRMMADLGYAGQVSLKQGDREIDFANYGVKIQVRFRTGQELQELSKGTQSGGEKSVTTAVYMMALQELTQVPFRCVDEINQGMDEKNERAVWSQLLEVCKKHSAQYFYMAPKFPYSLPFDDQVGAVCELLPQTEPR